jgi:hypothetical protein
MRIKLAAFTAFAMMALALTFPAVRTEAVTPPASQTAAQIRGLMTRMNAGLEASGAQYRVSYAEYMTGGGEEVGQTVFFANVGNKQLGAHFVPGDPRRGGGTNITYIIDQTEGAVDALSAAQTSAAIDRAMATWDAATCSTLPIAKLPDIPGTDLGVIELLLFPGQGGNPNVFADVTHAGWLPGGLLPPNVIAVTFTFIFINPDQSPTDIDNNNKADAAFREILYHDAFNWAINANIDVETIALHEAGHGLSQGHFGTLFQTTSNGLFHFSPRAVMNAGYTGIQQSLAGTDDAGHCSIWGSWPNN